MKKTFTTVLTLATAGVLLLHVPRISAQDDAPPPPPPPAGAPAGGPGAGGPGGPGGDFRARMAERIKTQLKATDEEWTVILPLLTDVETKQRAAMGGRFGGMGGGPGGPGGPGGGGRGQRRNGGPGGGQPDAATAGQPAAQPPGQPGGGWQGRGGSPESQALSETLKNDNASVDEIKTKLAAVRAQRKKAADELTQSRENLKKVLNMRQEASLVAMGILD